MGKIWSAVKQSFRKDAFRQHVHKFFAGHKITERDWSVGPILKTLPHFRVLEIEPGPKSNLWNYISSGARETRNHEAAGIEFLLLTPTKSERCVELLAMTAFYHSNPKHPLGMGHTFPIGEPWLDVSQCNYFLVSRPYAYGPEFEIWQQSNSHGHILWLLPITEAERDFKIQHGLEELEKRFEFSEIQYWLPSRSSVV